MESLFSLPPVEIKEQFQCQRKFYLEFERGNLKERVGMIERPLNLSPLTLKGKGRMKKEGGR
jgi:hypothetical protein